MEATPELLGTLLAKVVAAKRDFFVTLELAEMAAAPDIRLKTGLATPSAAFNAAPSEDEVRENGRW